MQGGVNSLVPNKISPWVSSHDRLEKCKESRAQRALNAYWSFWTPQRYVEPLDRSEQGHGSQLNSSWLSMTLGRSLTLYEPQFPLWQHGNNRNTPFSRQNNAPTDVHVNTQNT